MELVNIILFIIKFYYINKSSKEKKKKITENRK